MAYADPRQAGQPLQELYPALTGETDLRVTSDIETEGIDVLFIAAERGTARSFVRARRLPESLMVIDMTGDYRDAAGADADADGGLDFVQGIPELNRKAMVRGARHVAMPDAATTAVALSLLPLARNLMLTSAIDTQIVSNDHDPEPETLRAEMLGADVTRQVRRALTALQNSFNAEIEGIHFKGDTPEGMMAVTRVKTPVSLDEIRRLYDAFYDDHNFAFPVDGRPDLSDVRDTNKAFIHLDKPDSNTLVVTTVLDTDLKGGAGNAIHAMNLLFGLIEKVGL